MPNLHDQDDFISMILPKKLDHEASQALRAEILDHQGQNLALSAAHVEFLGGAGAELILATRAAWDAQDCDMTVVSPSAAFQKAALQLGLDQMPPFKQRGDK